MKFILQEDKFILKEESFILDEKFILNEAPKSAINRASAPVTTDTIEAEVKKITTMLDNIAKNTFNDVMILGTTFNTNIQQNTIKKIQNIDEINNLFKKPPFTNLDAYDENAIKSIGEILKEIIRKLKTGADININEYSNRLAKVSKATNTDRNHDVPIMSAESSQAEWKEAFKSLSGDTQAINKLWDQWYKINFSDKVEAVKKLGPAVEIEARHLGYTPAINPFIKFANDLIDNKYPVTNFSYSAIHNQYEDSIETKANLSITNPLLGNRNIYKLDQDYLESIIKKYFDAAKVDDNEQCKIIWALFDGSKADENSPEAIEEIDKTKKALGKSQDETLDDAHLEMARIQAVIEKIKAQPVNSRISKKAEPKSEEEFRNNLKLSESKLENDAKFNAKLAAAETKGDVNELRKLILFIINSYASSTDMDNFIKLFNVEDTNAEYNNFKYNASDKNVVKELKKKLKDTVIMPNQVAPNINSLIKQFIASYPDKKDEVESKITKTSKQTQPSGQNKNSANSAAGRSGASGSSRSSAGNGNTP